MNIPRVRRTRNRLIIMCIFFACLTSLYILLLKIKRMIHLTQMEENSVHSAIINDMFIYNSSFSKSDGKNQMKFVTTSRITNFYLPMTCESNDGYNEVKSNITITKIGESLVLGSCDVVEDPLYMSLLLDDFSLQIDIPDPLSSDSKNDHKEEHVVCMSHLVLYEDGATLLSLLKHFKNNVSKIYIYAASISDNLYKLLYEYSDKIELVPWKLPQTRKHDDFDKLKLDANFTQAAAEGSLTHCFLKHAPVVKQMTLVDLATLRFNSVSLKPDYQLSENVSALITKEWKIEKLNTFRVSVNSQNDVVLNEKCFVRLDTVTRNWEQECGDLMNPDLKTTASSRSIYIPKVIQYENLSVYEDALGRCTSYKATIEDRQKFMKFEFELENRVSSEVCEIELLRDDFKCRVAMDYNKKMFRRRTRLMITNKRAFLKFHNGCHL